LTMPLPVTITFAPATGLVLFLTVTTSVLYLPTVSVLLETVNV
jgi:hypothetical protein